MKKSEKERTLPYITCSVTTDKELQRDLIMYKSDGNPAIRVSVIIPVYNTAPYLQECLDSIRGQTLRETEILCVDDGSTDDSLSILKENAREDPRIIVMEQEHAGQSKARNTGLQSAAGKYVYFMDSDDVLETDALEKAYFFAEIDDLDIFAFNTEAFCEQGVKNIGNRVNYYKRNAEYHGVYRGKDLMQSMYENRDFKVSPWLQFIRKDLLDAHNIRFNEHLQLYEDNLFSFLCWMHAERIEFIDLKLHHRRIRSNSLMTKDQSIENVIAYIRCYLFVLEEIDRNGWTGKGVEKHLNLMYSLAKSIYRGLSEKDRSAAPTFLSSAEEEVLNRIRQQTASPQVNPFEKRIKVSVIIPFYNPTEEHVQRCLDSLMRQTFNDIEILLIDDASDKNIAAKVRDYAERDPRIRVFTNSVNIGPGFSRNVGLEHALGEYISFVDIDDYAAPDFLEKLYSKAMEENYDIVKGTTSYIRCDGTEFGNSSKQNESIRVGLQNKDPYYYLFTYRFQSGLYARSLLKRESIRFQLSRRGEDVLFLLSVCLKAKSFALAEDAVYQYCENPYSVVHSTNKEMLPEVVRAIRTQLEVLSGSVPETDPCFLRYAKQRLEYGLRVQANEAMSGLNSEIAEEMLHEFRQILLQLPCRERLCETDSVFRMLADYGVNLSRIPFSFPWRDPEKRDYIDVLFRWTRFITAHPEQMDTLRGSYREVLINTYDGCSGKSTSACSQKFQ